MNIRRMMSIAGIALLTAQAGVTVGCGTPAPKFAKVVSHDMPEGESWTGVYYNEVYGYLHMEESGDGVHAKWKRKNGSHWGELTGTTNGNVLKFDWTEHKYGVIGPAAESHGTGQFVYRMGDDGFAHLDGQYALAGSDEVGEWKNVKQKNIKPDLKSIKPQNEGDQPATSDTWK